MNKVNVIKIGGSLLTTTNHLPRLQAYLEQFTEHSNLLICGGGLEVERIRQHQLQYNLRDKECHWHSGDGPQYPPNMRKAWRDLPWQ